MAWIRVAGTLGLVVAASAAASGAQSQSKQVVTGPVAVYWMSAQTTSGFGAGMMGAGPGGRPQRPSMGAMMGMAMGRGGGAQHNVVLQLGSSRAPIGAPQAEHRPPPGLGAGDSLPLVTPQAAAPTQRTEEAPSMPREYQKPRGKLLIFWGCGEHARPGQPLVIDFSKMAEGQMPPGLEALTRGLGVTPMQPPSPGRNKTYGEWPNAQSRTTVPGEGSLVGAHVVRGNYSPEIRFSLTPEQDFLAPLQLVNNAIGPGGAAQVAWNSVPGARGYLASAIGGGGDQDTAVFWVSSEVQASAFALPDYLSNGDLARLVANHVLMGPETTSCTVPREVVQAAPHALLQLAAYGGEANFSYPARPADPKQPWNIEWTVKVRYKSQTGGILGMAMPGGLGGPRGGMAGDEDRGQGRAPQGQPQRPKRPGFGDILKGLGNIPQP